MIPILFKIFQGVAADRVWGLYYFLQLLVNLDSFEKLKITCNITEVLTKIKGVAYFEVASNPSLVKFKEEYLGEQL